MRPGFPSVKLPRSGAGGHRTAVVLGVLTLLIAACGDSDGGGTDLGGTRWALDSLAGTPAAPNSDVTLVFEDGARFAGNTGCNAYSGTWSSDGSSITLEVGPMTRALCGDDALQAQEGGFIVALGAASVFQVSGTTLTLEDDGGDVLATLSELSDTLAGTSWTAISINNGNEAVVSVVIGSEVTIAFDAEGNLSGSGGCNNYNGPYSTDGSDITIGPLSSQKRLCEPDIDNQEVVYFNALDNSTVFTVTQQRLELRDASGALQVSYQRAEG